jgi:hypothetical protein
MRYALVLGSPILLRCLLEFSCNHWCLYVQIAPRRGRPSLEAISCVGSFAKAMGPAMEPHIRSGLLDAMFFAGLSDKLIDALESISTR